MPQTFATSPQENSPACSGTSTTVCTGAGRDWTSTSLGALAVVAVKHPWDTSGVCLKLGDLAPRMAI